MARKTSLSFGHGSGGGGKDPRSLSPSRRALGTFPNSDPLGSEVQKKITVTPPIFQRANPTLGADRRHRIFRPAGSGSAKDQVAHCLCSLSPSSGSSRRCRSSSHFYRAVRCWIWRHWAIFAGGVILVVVAGSLIKILSRAFTRAAESAATLLLGGGSRSIPIRADRLSAEQACNVVVEMALSPSGVLRAGNLCAAG